MEPSNPHHSLSGSSILNRLIDIDTELSLYIHTKCLSFPRSILKVLEFSGDGRFWFPIPIALWLTPLSGNPHLNLILVHLFLGFFLDLFFVGLLKYTIRRPRPVYNKGMHLTVSVDHWSFPSGHSSRACFVGSFLWVSSELIKDGFASLELEGVSGSTKFMLRWFDLEAFDDRYVLPKLI